ncbi:MAG: (Fe-S)-binding protein, partial [Candidatus Thorarchaeota archaeon]
CDLNCPIGLTPMDLIKELKSVQIKELVKTGKVPYRVTFLLPFNKPNVFEFYEHFMMSPKEKENLAKWKSPSSSDELVILGCAISYTMQHLFTNPTLEKLLEGKTFAGGTNFCCGELYHRVGYPISKSENEDRLYSKYSDLGVKRLILFCNECYEAYHKEYPRISKDFEIVSMWEYIAKAIENGDLKIKRKLNFEVAFHDACVVKKYPELLNYPRKIVEATGAKIIELEHNRENALCCGIAVGLSSRELVKEVRNRRIDEIEKSGSKYIINTCPGCISSFGLDSRIQQGDYKVLSVLELLRMSCGEEIDVNENISRLNAIVSTTAKFRKSQS